MRTALEIVDILEAAIHSLPPKRHEAAILLIADAIAAIVAQERQDECSAPRQDLPFDVNTLIPDAPERAFIRVPFQLSNGNGTQG